MGYTFCMSFAKVSSAQTSLLAAHIVDIEVDLARGLYAFSIVGLPDKAVEESRDRVGAAIKNSGLESPKQKNQKVVISLAPADLKKEGPLFDLGIALAYLLAAGDIKFDPRKKLFLGELGLDGSLRPIKGALALVKKAKEKKFEEIFLPKENAEEAALIEGIDIFGANTLREVIDHLDTKKREEGEEKVPPIEVQSMTEFRHLEKENASDFSDIAGQESAKRALEIAAAGRHNIAMWGPAGTGKTMLAEAFAGILPPLSFDEALEVTAIHSIAGTLRETLVTAAPFRAPHHTASYVALIGGGAIPKPGEATLAHRGVLFLDEFPEFDRRVIDSLREPLESGQVSISRARGTASFPARFTLVAALNPCPCGNYGTKGRTCVCSASTLARYRQKISGPIVDRIDMWVEVGLISHSKLAEDSHGEKSSEIRKRVDAAREIQKKRFAKHGLKHGTNSELKAKEIRKAIAMEAKAEKLLTDSATKLDLSARSFHRCAKLARTIADLDGSETVKENHILEALRYRPKKME